MEFTKMHGCGNDYVYVNGWKETIKNPSFVARMVSDRHFGIGADGLILIKPSDTAVAKMEMYNADGSQGEMCGNGIRCVAKYIYDYGISDQTQIEVETKAGIKTLKLWIEDGTVCKVTVDMGEPILQPDKIPVAFLGENMISCPVKIMEDTFEVTCVSMGNPHAVIFVEDTKTIDIEKIGPMFEHHPLFPNRVNTEFIEIIDEGTMRMRVWERGSGETLACGTGACASVVAAVLNHKTKREVLVHLLGGDLFIQYDEKTNHVFMTGPATKVFDGTIDIQKWKEIE